MSARDSAPPAKLGTPIGSGPRTWVQTERAAHEAWGELTMKSPRAAAVMHHLVAMMGHQNAVAISQKTLAKLLGCSTDTIQRAVKELEAANWVQVVRLNGPGTVAAYVINSAVAWGERRDLIGRLSMFHATVVADAADQPEGVLDRTDLRRVPMIYPPEEAFPAGEGEPGVQIPLPGLEPVIVGESAAPPAEAAPVWVRSNALLRRQAASAGARIIPTQSEATIPRQSEAKLEVVGSDVFAVLDDGTRVRVATTSARDSGQGQPPR